MCNYKFFQNKKCECFPCHKTDKEEEFNCMMCFCPLYYIENCGGNFEILASGIKDCTYCLLPHYNYEYVIKKLTEYNKQLHIKNEDLHSIK